MTLTIDNSVASLLSHKIHLHAHCWRIKRTDGIELRFTDHCHSLVLADGLTYSPLGGGSSSARAREVGLQDTNAEFIGVLTDDQITFNDLHAGRYDDAMVDEYLVNWRYAWAGAIRYQRYWIFNVEFTGEVWKAQISGLPAKLRASAGFSITRSCRHVLGDNKCKVNLLDPANHVQQIIATIVTQRLKFITSFTPGTFLDDAFALGRLRWLSGANVGLESEVKSFVASSQTVELFLETPFDMATSDTFDMARGCNGSKSVCQGTFANILNHGGHPHVPGSDRLIKVAGT